MKFIARLLFFVSVTFLVCSCAGGVVSKNLVGLTDYKVDSKQMDGIWINNEAAISLKTVNEEQGVIRVVFLEDTDDLVKKEPMIFKIMKGESWLFFNVLPEDSKTIQRPVTDNNKSAVRSQNLNEIYYLWGRIIIETNKIILWMPLKAQFIKEIDDKRISGNYDSKPNDDGTYNIGTVRINDSAKNIIKLLEQKDNVFFNWDDPYFFIKLTK